MHVPRSLVAVAESAAAGGHRGSRAPEDGSLYTNWHIDDVTLTISPP